MPVTGKWANRLIFFSFALLVAAGLVVAAGREQVTAGDRSKPSGPTFSHSLIYGTYLGGELTDAVQAMTVDPHGRVTVVGTTQSTRFPDTATLTQPSSPDHGVDVFAGRLSADGSTLEYLFWFNAINAADVDEGLGVAVDGAGSTIVSGHTRSADFCALFGDVPGHDTTYNGNGDAFVLKIKADGSGLVYCTFLGGTDWDSATAVAVDNAGNVTLTGGTWSADFPVTTDAIAGEPNGLRDAFLARLDADGALRYATFWGGSGQEQAEALALNSGRAVITGWTNSTDLSTTGGALYRENNGDFDAFVMILDEEERLDYATYLGGIGEDRGAAVAVGPSGTVVVGGSTRSARFGARANADEREAPALDGFVATLTPAAGRAHYVTFLGGSGNDRIAGLAADAAGNVFVTGDTQSADFPTSHNAELNGEQDSFFALLSPLGNLRGSWLVGGSDWERGMAIAVGDVGTVYLGGATRSADFPTTAGAYDTTLNDDCDAYIVKLVLTLPPHHQLLLPIILYHS